MHTTLYFSLFVGVINCPLNSSTLILQGATDKDKEKKKKESILDLAKYLDKQIRVKFSGGREGKLGGLDVCCV